MIAKKARIVFKHFSRGRPEYKMCSLAAEYVLPDHSIKHKRTARPSAFYFMQRGVRYQHFAVRLQTGLE